MINFIFFFIKSNSIVYNILSSSGRLPVALPRYPFGFGLDPVGERMAKQPYVGRP